MVKAIERAILATLHYHDLFDYPLSLDELKQWLYQYQLTSNSKIEKTINKLVQAGKLTSKSEFLLLPGREKIARSRQRKEKESYQKVLKAKKIVRYLQAVPGILMIGLTGNVAMGNAQKEDDIDLLIITRANHLWLVRLVVMIWLQLLGIKRQPQKESLTKDKICPNLWLDETALVISEQNPYIAHEILAVQTLFDKNQTYRRFCRVNKLICAFLPNNSKFVKNGYSAGF